MKIKLPQGMCDGPSRVHVYSSVVASRCAKRCSLGRLLVMWDQFVRRLQDVKSKICVFGVRGILALVQSRFLVPSHELFSGLPLHEITQVLARVALSRRLLYLERVL